MKHSILSVALLTAICSTGWGSTVFTEGDNNQGDAGGMINSANITYGSGPLTDIIGRLTDITGGADMYEIFIGSPTTFSATTEGDTSLGAKAIVNPAIYLFKANGDGLFGNDNISGSTTQAAIPVGTTSSLTAGLYYILIAASGNLPENTNGTPIFGDLTNTTTVAAGSSSPARLKQYGPGAAPTTADAGKGYDIVLTGADFAQATPEPTTVALTGLGIAALAYRLRRKS